MGNDGSKPGRGGGDDGDDPDGPVRIRTRTTATAAGGSSGLSTPGDGMTRSNSTVSGGGGATLDGHTPYHAHDGLGSPPPPAAPAGTGGSFNEDRHSDAAYSALDDGPVSVSKTSSSASAASRHEIVQVHRAAAYEDGDVALLHPEVEALLAMAQFFPSDPGYTRGPSGGPAIPPPDALNITPVLVRPRSVMDLHAALSARWSGAGAATLLAQVMVSKEMDKLEHMVQSAIPAVIERNQQIKQLNEQLAQLPDMHATLQRQQQAVAQCVHSMQQLNALLPAHLRLEDLDEIIEWQEAPAEDDD